LVEEKIEKLTNTRIKIIAAYVVILALLFSIPFILLGNQYLIYIAVLSIVNVILAVSLRAITVSGQMSLGHVAFMSIGAYTSSILVMRLGFSTYTGLILGALAAMIVAAIIAFPVTRVRTIYLAMLTLFFGEIIRLIFTEWRNITGGTSGIVNIPPLDPINLFGWYTIEFSSKTANYYFVLILAIIVILFLYMIDRSYVGKTLKAISQDEQLALSSGINVVKYKVIIFCIGCFIAGLAGSFYAHYVSVITPDIFGIFPSLYVVIYVIVGGTKRFAGAIIGAIVLTIVPEFFRRFQEYQPFVYVVVLYLVIYLLPGGLVDLTNLIKSSFKSFNRSRTSHAGN
jgi:branched-chain amino acid transport system permease protein